MVPSDSDTPSEKKGTATDASEKVKRTSKKSPAVPLSPLQKRPFRPPQSEEASLTPEEIDDSPEEIEPEPPPVPTAAVFEGDLADTIRGSFREYVAENVDPQEQGPKKINIDGEFIRDHGFNVLSNMFQSVIKAVLPEKLEMTVPGMSSTDSEDCDEVGTPAVEQEDPAVDDDSVSVNVDVAGLLRTLFTPRTTKKEEEETPDPEDETT